MLPTPSGAERRAAAATVEQGAVPTDPRSAEIALRYARVAAYTYGGSPRGLFWFAALLSVVAVLLASLYTPWALLPGVVLPICAVAVGLHVRHVVTIARRYLALPGLVEPTGYRWPS